MAEVVKKFCLVVCAKKMIDLARASVGRFFQEAEGLSAEIKAMNFIPTAECLSNDVIFAISLNMESSKKALYLERLAGCAWCQKRLDLKKAVGFALAKSCRINSDAALLLAEHLEAPGSKRFYAQVQDAWPYLRENPAFFSRNYGDKKKARFEDRRGEFKRHPIIFKRRDGITVTIRRISLPPSFFQEGV